MRLTKWTTMSMIALAFICLGAPRLLAEESEGARVRWDLFHFQGLGTPTITLTPGGTSTSQATFEPAQLAGDNSTITITGGGTFSPNDRHDVTGGGTWTTVDGTTAAVNEGTYRVTELVFFETTGGSLAGTGIIDDVGSLADTREGLAVMKVAYSDGAKGTLVVVCNLGLPTSPPAMIEGTTATKGVVDYAVPLIPVPPASNPDLVTGNTIFHVIHRD
jgi:hypothetical protein